ncbi:hypothetical protein IPN41_01740 [Candidatus Falkowbacteria bacterium]|nr:MAG: hypothetical protein IPN41_01740 [Candidatus Falkowbacteria bacterium]
MDVVSHGLWGGLAFGRTKRQDYWLAFLFGVLPDVLSFGIFTIAQLVGIEPRIDWANNPTNADIPAYVHVLYNYTHSFIIFAVVFLGLWLILKRPYIPLLAWGIHIILDIFTHSDSFFATPFLWPLSDFKIDGTPWSHPLIFFPNWILIIIGYTLWFIQKRRKQKKTL